MNLENVVIKQGWDSKERHRVAEIYDAAFGEKLALAIPNSKKRRQLLVDGFQPEHSLVACYEGQIIGIAGFHDDKGSITDGIDYLDLLADLGLWGGHWATLVFYFLERDPEPGQLLLEGLAIDADFRGKGIGSQLLDALLRHARNNGYKEVSLDVIGDNQQAQSLYRKKGFKTVKTEHFHYMQWLLGFGSAITMQHAIQ